MTKRSLHHVQKVELGIGKKEVPESIKKNNYILNGAYGEGGRLPPCFLLSYSHIISNMYLDSIDHKNIHFLARYRCPRQ